MHFLQIYFSVYKHQSGGWMDTYLQYMVYDANVQISKYKRLLKIKTYLWTKLYT